MTTPRHHGGSARPGIPSQRHPVDVVEQATLEACLKHQPALCVICGRVSATHPGDPAPARVLTQRVPDELLPPVELCEEHWDQYRCDWLLLGWCVDHYGQALRYCPTHQATIEPL